MAKGTLIANPQRGSRRLVTAPSLADQAYEALREDIASGRLEPAAKLTERALADRLGVSPTPIREALQRLEHERLIVRTGSRSIRVAAPSFAHLRELALLEAALRGVAARLAAEKATDDERARMSAKLDELEALPHRFPDDKQIRERALRLTRELHELIDQAARSETLTDMIATATAFDRSFRSRFAKKLYADWETVSGRHEQHREIVAAIIAADPDRADQVMRDHILAARRSFREVVEAATDGA